MNIINCKKASSENVLILCDLNCFLLNIGVLKSNKKSKKSGISIFNYFFLSRKKLINNGM